MRRRIAKKSVSPQGDTTIVPKKDGFILVLAGYGYQLRMSGTAPGWGPLADADIFATKEKAEKVCADLKRYGVYPTIKKAG